MKFSLIARKLLKYINLDIRFRHNKIMVTVPLINGMGLDNLKANSHEKFMSKILAELYEDRGVFLDIGVNVGQTLIKFKTLFPTGKYIGVEPNPNCVFYAQNLIRKNNFKYCVLIACGIMDSVKLLSLNYGHKTYNETASGATFVPGYKSEWKPDSNLILPCISMDEILTNTSNDDYIELIKIDVEGAELYALKGMIDTIQKNKPSIIFESLSPNTSTPIRNELNKEIVQLFKKLDYEIFEIQFSRNRIITERVSDLSFERHQDSTNNFLAKPKQLTLNP